MNTTTPTLNVHEKIEDICIYEFVKTSVNKANSSNVICIYYKYATWPPVIYDNYADSYASRCPPMIRNKRIEENRRLRNRKYQVE